MLGKNPSVEFGIVRFWLCGEDAKKVEPQYWETSASGRNSLPVGHLRKSYLNSENRLLQYKTKVNEGVTITA